MRITCNWCGNEQPRRRTVSKESSSTVCLQCIDRVLREVGQEAEHYAWLDAFSLERENPTAIIETVDDARQHAQ